MDTIYKKMSMVLFILLITGSAYSQSSFNYYYDAAGNRICRTIITLAMTSNSDSDSSVDNALIEESYQEEGSDLGNDSENNMVEPFIAPDDINANDLSNSFVSTTPENEKGKTIGAFVGDVALNIFPNPTTRSIEVNMQQHDELKSVEYYLFSAKGALILNKHVCDSKFSIDLSDQKAGAYILRILCNGNAQEWKIIKE